MYQSSVMTKSKTSEELCSHKKHKMLTESIQYMTKIHSVPAQLAKAVEYTDCISAGGVTPPQTSVLYMIIYQSHGKAPALDIWGI